MTGRIRVSGFRRPINLPTQRHRPGPVAPIRPVNLIGPAGALGVLMATLLWGTPHVLLFSSSTGARAYLFYDDCAYAGLDGRMIHLRGSACPLLRLLKSPGRR